MKTAIDKLSSQKAQEELKKFTVVGSVSIVVTLLILWWLSIAAAGASARALMLTKHKANKERKDIQKYIGVNILVMTASLIIIFSMFSN